MGQFPDHPALGSGLHPCANQGDRLPAKINAQVAILERRKTVSISFQKGGMFDNIGQFFSFSDKLLVENNFTTSSRSFRGLTPEEQKVGLKTFNWLFGWI